LTLVVINTRVNPVPNVSSIASTFKAADTVGTVRICIQTVVVALHTLVDIIASLTIACKPVCAITLVTRRIVVAYATHNRTVVGSKALVDVSAGNTVA
jgi:hypothetical protein